MLAPPTGRLAIAIKGARGRLHRAPPQIVRLRTWAPPRPSHTISAACIRVKLLLYYLHPCCCHMETNRNGSHASDIQSAHRKIGPGGTSVIYLAFGNLQLYIQVSALWGWSGA